MNDYFRQRRGQFSFQQFIRTALSEDVGDGDHTSLAIIPATGICRMELLVKETGVLAGVEAAKRIFKTIDPKCTVQVLLRDGSRVNPGQTALRIKGNMRRLLAAERLVLNVVQRMSGIATKTATMQELCRGSKARVIDTRKTTPGFRFFEKWAVVIGGGANHRYALYDMVMIKDNHIDLAGGIPQAIDKVHRYLKKKRKKLRIEVEARSMAEVREIIEHGGVHRIMLDNFDPSSTREAVQYINGVMEVESSGGINENTIAAYAATGVDFISVGALTHHVRSLDLSLKVV